ncbi:NAD(P)H-binding protein [Ktedonobacter sp. SOSP1-85]|uniref:NAD(P)-dependent oxidoreductase n=1 Tax=Ktedonobacter sp. SOSP1-85 TaxID=2778367 RepID=UPI001915AE2E
MKIAIIGATHGIGLAMAQAVLADSHEVSALARIPDRMPMSHVRLCIVAGDAQEPDAIAKVVEGQDVVCDCLGTTRVMQTITLSPVARRTFRKRSSLNNCSSPLPVSAPAIAEDTISLLSRRGTMLSERFQENQVLPFPSSATSVSYIDRRNTKSEEERCSTGRKKTIRFL